MEVYPDLRQHHDDRTMQNPKITAVGCSIRIKMCLNLNNCTSKVTYYDAVVIVPPEEKKRNYGIKKIYTYENNNCKKCLKFVI